ncbi:MAG: hypothetical protein M3Z09_06445 [Acidobacteriota bacterium]|nr:hypothetical protein [Acidobacteriota bacterium]
MNIKTISAIREPRTKGGAASLGQYKPASLICIALLSILSSLAFGQSPSPTVHLTDLTQGSGYYFVGDSYRVTVNGPPHKIVSLKVNGGPARSQKGWVTNGQGVLVISATWAAADIGAYSQVWYVGDVPAAPNLLFSVLNRNDTSGPVSIPNSFNAEPAILPCLDITGNWIITPQSGSGGAEWDFIQTGNSIRGTSYVNSKCGVTSSPISGYISGSIFILSISANSACGVKAESATVSVTGSACTIGSGTISPGGRAIQLKPKTSRY